MMTDICATFKEFCLEKVYDPYYREVSDSELKRLLAEVRRCARCRKVVWLEPEIEPDPFTASDKAYGYAIHKHGFCYCEGSAR